MLLQKLGRRHPEQLLSTTVVRFDRPDVSQDPATWPNLEWISRNAFSWQAINQIAKANNGPKDQLLFGRELARLIVPVVEVKQFLPGMNGQRATVGRLPCAVLNSLLPMNDCPSPRLQDG